MSVVQSVQVMENNLMYIYRSLFYSSRGKHLGPCDTNTAVPKNVLRYIEKGQHWPEGDAAFHRRILVPTLLVHGLQDKKITLVQECEMERVRGNWGNATV